MTKQTTTNRQTNATFYNQIQQMSKTAVWTASISLNNFNTKFFNFAQPGHGITYVTVVRFHSKKTLVQDIIYLLLYSFLNSSLVALHYVKNSSYFKNSILRYQRKNMNTLHNMEVIFILYPIHIYCGYPLYCGFALYEMISKSQCSHCAFVY